MLKLYNAKTQTHKSDWNGNICNQCRCQVLFSLLTYQYIFSPEKPPSKLLTTSVPHLLSESISTVTFFPVNLCLLPILKPRVLRRRRSRPEQYPLEIVFELWWKLLHVGFSLNMTEKCNVMTTIIQYYDFLLAMWVAFYGQIWSITYRSMIN